MPPYYGYGGYVAQPQPYGYQQPQQQAYQQYPQNFAQSTPQQPQQQSTNSTGVYWCHGLRDAEAWAVAPGNAVAIMDIDAPVLYLRSCDTMGKPSTTIYDLVERSAASKMPQTEQADYITRDEFERFKADFTARIGKEEKE